MRETAMIVFESYLACFRIQ